MMSKATAREVKVEQITGEVYYDYTDYSDSKKETQFQRLAAWLSKRADNLSVRLITLRVYDHKRVDG